MNRPSGKLHTGFKNLNYFLLLLGFACFLQGCGYKQNHFLFQSEKRLLKHGLKVVHLPGTNDTIPGEDNYEHIIREGDRIAIKFLNNYDITTGITIAGGSKEEVTFLVNTLGEVTLPMVGQVKVSGLTREMVARDLEVRFSAVLKEPRIEVQIVDLKVSLLGEVTTPGQYPIEGDKVTLVEILARAGGITSNGNARTVRLVRTNQFPDTTIVAFIDMTNVDVLQEKNLVLHDKDIIVVEPTNIRVVTLAIQPYYGLLSLLSTLGTVALFIIEVSRPNTPTTP
jgi:polysaccharide biosynthesis/export protein